MGYAGDEGERIGLGFEKERNITISNSEIAYTFGGAFLTWGKGVSGTRLTMSIFTTRLVATMPLNLVEIQPTIKSGDLNIIHSDRAV